MYIMGCIKYVLFFFFYISVSNRFVYMFCCVMCLNICNKIDVNLCFYGFNFWQFAYF